MLYNSPADPEKLSVKYRLFTQLKTGKWNSQNTRKDLASDMASSLSKNNNNKILPVVHSHAERCSAAETCFAAIFCPIKILKK